MATIVALGAAGLAEPKSALRDNSVVLPNAVTARARTRSGVSPRFSGIADDSGGVTFAVAGLFIPSGEIPKDRNPCDPSGAIPLGAPPSGAIPNA